MNRTIALAAAALLCAAAHAQRVPLPTGEGNFTAEQLLRGVGATEAQCAQLASAVWARTPHGDAECLRYWTGGLQPGTPARRVLVYLPPDQIAGDRAEPSYATRSPASVQAIVDGMAQRLGVPVVLLARPGTFGSSGDHRQRRREAEPRLVASAVDGIKARLGVEEIALVGLSGGGHLVASLLAWRQDVVCAVPASAVSSPRLRWETLGLKADYTGFTDSYEPVAQLKAGGFHPRLRVFVLGDTRDSNVPWSTQLPLAHKLRELGVAVEVVNGEGSDGQRHALGGSAQLLGALCLKDMPTPAILERAAQGLKG